MPMAPFVPGSAADGFGSTAKSRALPEAILFDMDEVLINAERSRFEAYLEAADRLRLPKVSWDDYVQKYNMSVRDLYVALQLPVPWETIVREVIPRLKESARSCLVNADAGPLLERLKRNGVRIGLVTNNYYSFVHEVLGQAGLLGYFDAIVAADHVQNPKPDPESLEIALKALGVDPSDAWMIGDSFKDEKAAKAAGVHFVGLGVDGDHRIESLREVGRDLA